MSIASRHQPSTTDRTPSQNGLVEGLWEGVPQVLGVSRVVAVCHLLSQIGKQPAEGIEPTAAALQKRCVDDGSACPDSTSATTPERLSGLLGALAAEIAPSAPDLAGLLTAWAGLPDAIKAGIMAMVKATAREGNP